MLDVFFLGLLTVKIILCFCFFSLRIQGCFCVRLCSRSRLLPCFARSVRRPLCLPARPRPFCLVASCSRSLSLFSSASSFPPFPPPRMYSRLLSSPRAPWPPPPRPIPPRRLLRHLWCRTSPRVNRRGGAGSLCLSLRLRATLGSPLSSNPLARRGGYMRLAPLFRPRPSRARLARRWRSPPSSFHRCHLPSSPLPTRTIYAGHGDYKIAPFFEQFCKAGERHLILLQVKQNSGFCPDLIRWNGG